MLIGTADDDDEVKALRDFTVVTQCTDYGFVSPPFEKKKPLTLPGIKSMPHTVFDPRTISFLWKINILFY